MQGDTQTQMTFSFIAACNIKMLFIFANQIGKAPFVVCLVFFWFTLSQAPAPIAVLVSPRPAPFISQKKSCSLLRRCNC